MPDDPAGTLRPTPYRRGVPDGDTKLAETKARLPGPDTPYEAAALADTHGTNSLVLITFKDGFTPGGVAYTALQYAHIDLGEFVYYDDGQRFAFTFAGLQPKLVTVSGRNLVRIYELIGLHQLHWIRQVDRNFLPGGMADDGRECITRIEVTDWKRPKGKGKEKDTRAAELVKLLASHGEPAEEDEDETEAADA
jgi:hypothetical protein